MSKKLATMNLKGNEYAKVAERIRQFREDCPNGLIDPVPTITGDMIMFTARVLKDKAKPTSAEAIGHSYGKLTGDKAFEKHETIAVGRALANLGYLASGEIASADEMEDFYAYKEEQERQAIEEAIERMEEVSTLDELKNVFISLGTLIKNEKVIEAKNKKKEELCELSKSTKTQTNGSKLEKEKSQDQNSETSSSNEETEEKLVSTSSLQTN